jgi:hypothetical protein
MEIKGLKRDLSKDLNRQIYGDGSGKLAVVTAQPSSTTLTVDATDWLEEGMVIDVVDPTTGVKQQSGAASSIEIVSINESTKVITITGTLGTFNTNISANDIIVRSSNGVNSFGKELTGLGAIVKATGELHEIDPATTPVWAATEVALGSVGTPGTLTELNLINLVQSVDKKGGDVDVFLASPGVYNAYWNLLQGFRQFTNGAGLTGGQRSFTFEALGKPIRFVSDYAAPKGTLYALSSKELVINRKKDWSWMDRDGSMWSRVADTDAYEARIYQYSEIGTYRRNAHAKLSNIAEL